MPPVECLSTIGPGRSHTITSPLSRIANVRAGELRDTLGERSIVIRYDGQHRTASVFDAAGREIPSLVAYWFAWYAFHPDAEVFETTEAPDDSREEPTRS